jgi:hypothetical protein
MPLARPPRRPALATLLAIALACVGAGLLARGAARALAPAPDGPVTIAFSTPTSGLTGGSAVTYSVSSTSGAVLSGAVAAHVCATGAGISNTNDFGYQGTFCVKQAGITSGGLTGGDYATSTNFSGVSTSGNLTFHAGTGSVTWLDDLFGLHTLVCDASDPCDLVVQVNYNVSPFVSYFSQPLTFAGGETTTTAPGETTTTAPGETTTTTPGATTTTTPGATTTTTPGDTTTTTLDPGSTTTTTPGGTTTTIGAFGASTGSGTGSSGSGAAASGSSLPFTGANSRDLASAALLLIAAGLILMGQRFRRRTTS